MSEGILKIDIPLPRKGELSKFTDLVLKYLRFQLKKCKFGTKVAFNTPVKKIMRHPQVTDMLLSSTPKASSFAMDFLDPANALWRILLITKFYCWMVFLESSSFILILFRLTMK